MSQLMSRPRTPIVVASARRTDLRVGVLIGSLLLLSTSCDVKPGSHAGGVDPILGGGISNELDALALVDPDVYAKVDDCVDSAEFKIYTGDAEWQRTWIDVGESRFGLRQHCEKLAAQHPSEFDQIHVDWVAWERFVASN
jgi:hypothetical protein